MLFLLKKSKKLKKKTILLAPLDWGLGHATRCIPLIQEFQRYGADVIIAATGPLKTLLQLEFPQNTFVYLPAYNINYASNSRFLIWRLFLQIPRIIKTIVKEHGILKKIVKKYDVDLIISDNRFGLFHSEVNCIYITHQLSFNTGNAFLNSIADEIHRWFINKYSRCWVPDFENQSIAGKLSHPSKKIDNLQYIGCLSRCEKSGQQVKKYHLLVLMSGPEPQRSILEKIILEQVPTYTGNILFIRGLPGITDEIQNKESNKQNIIFKNHVNGRELSALIQQSELVICRSGYTSIMDLIKLRQKAILVPTPGQPEQEYLANYLNQKKMFYIVQQKKFSLIDDVSKATGFNYMFPSFDMHLYIKAVEGLLSEESGPKI